MEQQLLADCLNIFSSLLITEIVITVGKITHILSQVEGGGGLIEKGKMRNSWKRLVGKREGKIRVGLILNKKHVKV